MMNWQEYERKFRLLAIEQDFDEAYVSRCLSYARILHENGLPIIYTPDHFSLLVGYEFSYIERAAENNKYFYRTFPIPKKAGGERIIAEPLPNLKIIQRWILDNILYKWKPSRFAKAFIPHHSIRDNARFHRNQAMVLSLDLEDFFPSIGFQRILNLFRRMGYTSALSRLLAKLCTLEGSLPQGAPTSPALSNLVTLRLDKRLGGYALKHHLRYTRYADDITFSGNFDVGKLIYFVRQVVTAEKLKLNENKTRLMEKHQRQEVTGIVVNKKLQAPRNKRRQLRQAIYYIEKFGINSHMNKLGIDKSNYLKHLMGLANHFLFLNPTDRDAHKALGILRGVYEDTKI